MFKVLGTNIVVKPDTEFYKKKYPRLDADGNSIFYELESGIVVGIGPGEVSYGQYVPTGIEVGQRVFFEPDDPKPITYKGQLYVLIQTYDIIGVEDVVQP